ncbi:MAG TPA: O-antigen ligase family protein [Terracidiphilus sp.]|nr:O-antigen ligase family protein [Terracidiphilus sp.]
MRRPAWFLLLLYAFAIPWEYSLDLGEPLGNIARVLGLVVLLAAIPAILQQGELRRPGAMQWMVLALFLWLCCTYFWTIDPATTLEKFPGYFQEMMIVWIVWEFAEKEHDLRALARAVVAGSWVLGILTLLSAASPAALAAGAVRFAAAGQDPNDVARFLDLGFPLAALLLDWETRLTCRLLAVGYLPLGFVAVLLTASRGGFVAALLAMIGCCVLLFRKHRMGLLAALATTPLAGAAIWAAIPHRTLGRLATIPSQLQGGDLNQRINIWAAGWQAFKESPFFGHGAGTFVGAARMAPIDTAHNTVLSLGVEGGTVALVFAVAIFVLAARSALMARGQLRIALLTALLVWTASSLVGTVAESRTTWLLFAIIALAGRFAAKEEAGATTLGCNGEQGSRSPWLRAADAEPAK